MSTFIRSGQHKHFLHAGSGLLIKFLANFFSLCILARLLSLNDFGIYSVLSFIYFFALTLGSLSANYSIIHAPKNCQETFSFWFFATFFFNLIFCFLLFLLLPLVTPFFGFVLSAFSFSLLSSAVFFSSMANVAEAVYQNNGSFLFLRNVDAYSHLFSLSFVGPLSALFFKDYRAFLVGLACLGLSRCIFFYISLRPTFNLTEIVLGFKTFTKRVDHHYVLAQVLNFFALNADNMVVATKLGMPALGMYSRAYQLVSLPGNIIGEALEKVFFPHFRRITSAKKDSFEDLFLFFTWIARLCFPIIPFLVVFADDMVRIFLGAKWHGTGDLIRILSPAIFLRTSTKFLSAYLKAKGKTGFLSGSQFFYAIAICLASFLGSFNGLLFVCAFVCLVIFFYWLLLSYYCFRNTFRSFYSFSKDIFLFFCVFVFLLIFSLVVYIFFEECLSARRLFALFLSLFLFYFFPLGIFNRKPQ